MQPNRLVLSRKASKGHFSETQRIMHGAESGLSAQTTTWSTPSKSPDELVLLPEPLSDDDARLFDLDRDSELLECENSLLLDDDSDFLPNSDRIARKLSSSCTERSN